MKEPEYGPITIVVAGEEVILSPENLKFNEATLGQFLNHEGSWYDYFGRHLANAQIELAAAKEEAEVQYMIAFDAYKAEGSSDKRAESQARSESGVREARRTQMKADRYAKLLQQHLRSFDKAHDNAISLGHNLRKELELTGNRIFSRINAEEIPRETLMEHVVGRYQEGDK